MLNIYGKPSFLKRHQDYNIMTAIMGISCCSKISNILVNPVRWFRFHPNNAISDIALMYMEKPIE